MERSKDVFTFTVGKLDAGMAILLGERAHLIEFPSVLLPPGATAGSIVNISVHQDHTEERKRENEFWKLQEEILSAFGNDLPETPQLTLRNVTQTSITLEWPPIALATAKLRSLDLYRNGQRLAAIPAPTTNTSTKVSGLELSTDYTFQLILRTTAGTFPSNLIKVQTHSMTDTSGISVCFGNVQDSVLLENAKMALREMGAKWSDKIEIDTTHFICTSASATPPASEASNSSPSAPGVLYQRALQLSIPILQPHWILACHYEKKMVPVAPFYLGAAPVSGMNYRTQSMSQASFNRSAASPPPSSSNQRADRSPVRASMPPPARHSPTTPPDNTSGFINQPHSPETRDISEEAPPETPVAADADTKTSEDSANPPATDKATKRKSRAGTMNKDFKFPSPSSSPQTQIPDVPVASESSSQSKSPPPKLQGDLKGDDTKQSIVTPSSIEVPPPPPVEKEKMDNRSLDDADDEIGSTEEVDLS